jgi:hypothetical protein
MCSDVASRWRTARLSLLKAPSIECCLQLPDGVAEDLASRLEDFVSYCAPPTIEGEFTVGVQFVNSPCCDMDISGAVKLGIIRRSIS